MRLRSVRDRVALLTGTRLPCACRLMLGMCRHRSRAYERRA